ncbi:MAG: xylulokinase [Bacillota bacterium]
MREAQCLLGVDIGTSGTKTVLIREDGATLAESSAPSRLITPAPGHVEQDPQEILKSAVDTIRECMQRSGVHPGRVAGIAVGGQMAGIMMIDRDWNPVTPYDSWLDTRCSPYVQQMREHSADVTAISGGPPSYSHGPKILWWMHEHPEVFGRAHKVIMPSAYVSGCLAGLSGDEAFIDATFVHFSNLCDSRRSAWSEELCSRFAVPIDKLARIVEPWEVIGRLTAEMAQHTGLLAGTPIMAGAGDTALAMLGAGVVEAGMVYDAAGTASVLAACVSDYEPDTRHQALFTARAIPAGLRYAIGYINGGGLNLRWFRDEFLRARGAVATLDYAELDQLAASVEPGSGGLFFVPHLGGRVTPNQPDIRGAWMGFSWSHQTGHFYRALLESVAYEYALYLAIERELAPGTVFSEVRVVGGGARSPVWNQIKADVLGIPYVQLNLTEAGALSAAVVAGFGVGLFTDWKSAVRRFVHEVRRYEPNPAATERYRHAVQFYRELLEGQGALWRNLAAAQAPRG